jgi:hypothetical protein
MKLSVLPRVYGKFEEFAEILKGNLLLGDLSLIFRNKRSIEI